MCCVVFLSWKHDFGKSLLEKVSIAGRSKGRLKNLEPQN